MATLVSPGVSISVIDQSINVGAGPGTVPLIFIATQQDKPTPDGAEIAPGTTKANAGVVWSITSQRDLVQTFGDPVFYSVSGTSLNGYPLNEYGLLATYSYLGIANLARVVRADIDTAGLEPTPIPPTSPADPGTYWFDESDSGSAYGLFIRTGVAPSQNWISVVPKFIYNVAAVAAPPAGDGAEGDIAISFVSNATSSRVLYYVKRGSAWVLLGSSGAEVIVSPVWPDLPTTTTPYWIKTTEPAQGANFVLRRMDATLGSFVPVEVLNFPDDAAAIVEYNKQSIPAAGQIYAKTTNVPPPAGNNAFEFRTFPSNSIVSVPLPGIVGSETVPTSGPSNGQLWFNAEIGVNGEGQSTVDILTANGAGAWISAKLQGFSNTTLPGFITVYAQSGDPRDNVPPIPALKANDVWIDTDQGPYPVIYYWNGTAWILINNEDQTTNHGIIFTDVRPNPVFGDDSGENNGGAPGYPNLDPDAPDADLYPKGFMLWNTRYSTNVVKEWQEPFVANGITAEEYNGSTGRWVTVSGNNAAGNPYMGSEAQKIAIVRAIQSEIVSNEQIRAEDIFFNLISAPGYVEAIDEMLALNDDRKNTGFVVADTPFTLVASGTALQNWATNASNALGNGDEGLVSASKYFSAWYPSGLATNVDGTDVVVPPTHMALRTLAYSDQVSYPWFAPAGLQRGVVNNAAAIGYVNDAGQFIPVRLNEGQRDILYQNGINPIRVMPTGGIVVFGQKTRQPYASATDRINVVRLENYLRYQLNLLALPFLFEPNDTTTRKAVKDAFDRFLAELITLRALYDFLVVCDLSNNTPARIDRNELWIDIAIQPVKAIEFIYIPIRIMNTGTSLALP